MTETAANAPATTEEMQKAWPELTLRVARLESEKLELEKEIKALRLLLERTIEHRQKSHGELVMLLTGLVSKLPLNDVGVIISRLVEHNANVGQMLSALGKGTAELAIQQPVVLQTLEQTRRELLAALRPLVAELIQLEAPLEPELLQSLLENVDVFYTPRMVRANRGFVKGQVPRERIVREFGQEALPFFTDMTTDSKRNPNPKTEEIVLTFRHDFEALLQSNPNFLPEKRQDLLALYHRVQRSKAHTEQSRAQRVAFQKLSFLVELLHYYEHQNTEPPDVLFAQRLPALVEQLVLSGPQDPLDEKLIATAEQLMKYVINPDHRHMIVNNIGKAGGIGKALKYILRLRGERLMDHNEIVTEFIRYLIPNKKAPPPETLVPLLRLIPPEPLKEVLRSLMFTDRLRRDEADTLARSLAATLGVKGLEEDAKTGPLLSPEMERQLAWGKIKDMLAQRGDAVTIASAIRDRLNAKYDADELRQSWLTLSEADPMSLMKVFCQIPYRPDGKTDPIARPVIETYVTRLTHEKYATTYKKVLNSLKNMFKAKADSPTLLNFLALVRWVSPEAADKLSADIGIPVAAQ